MEEITEKIKSKGFAIQDEDGRNTVTLYGTGPDGEKLEVEFDIQDSTIDSPWGDEEYDEEAKAAFKEAMGASPDDDDDEDEHDDDPPGYECTLRVKKPSGTLEFQLTVSAEPTVKSMRYVPAGDEEATNLYMGPAIDQLEPDMQETIYKYLEERHVDEDMAVFICMYADAKEQREYIRWLSNLRDFL